MSYANNAPIGAVPARRRLSTAAGALAITVAAAAVVVTGVVVADATRTAPTAITIGQSGEPSAAHPKGGGRPETDQTVPRTVEGLNGKKLVPRS